MIEIQTIPLGPIQVNCHILIHRERREFIVIDAPLLAPVFSELQDSGYKAKQILLTHGHIDHIAALRSLRDKLRCPVALHEKDRFLLSQVENDPFREVLHAEIPPEPDEWLTEESNLQLGTQSIKVIHTPGHTPGGVSFYIKKTGIFTGDSLFFESIGRTDLPGGNTEELLRSIREKLFSIPDNTPVFPGHGPTTTIGHEKKFNPFIRQP